MDETEAATQDVLGRSEPWRPRLQAGQLAAGRFRVVRFVAEGGRGQVYEAEDVELGERVALKTVRAEIAADERATERFRREIQLARRVTHPNVCRTFDVFRHEGPDGAVAFLTMEMLPGETLAERLHRAGRMTEGEARPLFAQMAEGLAAAHRVGIVHRDFKPGNVVLVPDASSPGLRAVVTDFGQAHAPAAVSDSGPLTGAGEAVGTPAYMAPEQLEGAPITPATDVYALGLVLYETLVGVPPFEGGSPLSAAVKRLKQKPEPPHLRVPGLERRLEAVVLRCLERRPEDRFADAGEVAAALAGSGGGLTSRTRRLGAGVLLLALVALAVTAAIAGYARVRERAAPAPQKQRRAVAVLGFRNAAGRPDRAWLSTALSEALTTELGAGERLRTIPGENVSRLKADLGLPDGDTLSRDTLARVRSRLGADVVVLGSYIATGSDSGGQVRLDVRIQDAALGETVASVAETGTEHEVLGLIARTGARLRRELGVADAGSSRSPAVRASFPAAPEAARLYAEGLARLRLFDARAARDLLADAVAAEPAHPLPHSGLADAWSSLGYGTKAREEAKKALDLSSSLPREGRLAVEARYRELGGEGEKAIELYRLLADFFPDNLEYGLRLAAAQTKAGGARAALAAADELRRLPAPAGLDPRIDLVEASAAQALSDWKREEAAAARAAAKGQAQGATLVVARARLLQGWALRSLGEARAANAASAEAKRLYQESGDRSGAALAANTMAVLLWQQGDLDSARTLYEEALATSREIGDRAGESTALNNMAILRKERGEYDQALALYEDSLAIDRETGDKGGVAAILNNLANVLLQRGDLAGARRRHEEALALRREIGDRAGEAASLVNLAEVLLKHGDLAAAEANCRGALARSRDLGDRRLEAYALFDLGETLVERGDLAGARAAHAGALAIRLELGEKTTSAESRLALARLTLEEGRAAHAAEELRPLLPVFEAASSVADQALARAVLSRALVAAGEVRAAEEHAARAERLVATSDRPDLRLSVLVTSAGARAGSDGEARARLEDARAEAHRIGLAGLELEARLVRAEIDARRGDRGAAAALRGVEKDARARGFVLLARRAAASASLD
jgi:eukaryotic-like serine/threonine-protein kinase